jgi:hypothetical protein
MTLCTHCGVELDEGFKICPLCGKEPGNKEDQEPVSNNYPSDIIRLQKKENKRSLWELSGIIAFSGIVVCTMVELLISKTLRWSLFPDISILASWVILTLFQFTYKRTLMIVTFLIFTILAALFLFNLISTGRGWFLPVGLPIAMTAFFATGTIIALYKAAWLEGLNLIAAALIILSGFCIITETILDKYLNDIVNIRWSLIVAISVVPVALVFFFYHYRLKKGKQLDSLFHI